MPSRRVGARFVAIASPRVSFNELESEMRESAGCVASIRHASVTRGGNSRRVFRVDEPYVVEALEPCVTGR